ncbi:unnamed protein product, partial [Prorocentrum cordatum]
ASGGSPAQPRAAAPGVTYGGVYVAVAVQTLGFNADAFRDLVTRLGGGEDTTLADLFSVFEADLKTALAATTGSGGQPLTGIERGRFVRQLGELGALGGFDLPQLGIFTPQRPAPAREEPPAGVRGRELITVIIQGDRREYRMLDKAKLKEVDETFEATNGGPTADYEDTSPEQISALAFVLAQDEAPYTDFGIWGPFGKRTAKFLSFRAQVFVAGEWVTKVVQGPPNFAAWRRGWRVFRTAALKLGLSVAGPLDAYEEGVRTVSASFRDKWGLICVVEDHMRSERWERVRVLIERCVSAGSLKQRWDPNRPWGAVLAYSAYGTGEEGQWWYRHLDLPCLQSSAVKAAAGRVADVEGTTGLEHIGLGAGSVEGTPRGDFPAGRDRPRPAQEEPDRSRKQRRVEAQVTRFQNFKEKGARPDGRHVIDDDGVELCFAWNRDRTGCAAGACPQRRGHLCEWCLGPRRAVDSSCPKRPTDWKPPEKGGGRGARGAASRPGSAGTRQYPYQDIPEKISGLPRNLPRWRFPGQPDQDPHDRARVLPHPLRGTADPSARERRSAEDGVCTAGLRNPAQVVSQWPELRQTMARVRAALLPVRAGPRELWGLAGACGERRARAPPSEAAVDLARRAVGAALGLDRRAVGEHHPSPPLRHRIVQAVLRQPHDTDTHVGAWLQHVACHQWLGIAYATWAGCSVMALTSEFVGAFLGSLQPFAGGAPCAPLAAARSITGKGSRVAQVVPTAAPFTAMLWAALTASARAVEEGRPEAPPGHVAVARFRTAARRFMALLSEPTDLERAGQPWQPRGHECCVFPLQRMVRPASDAQALPPAPVLATFDASPWGRGGILWRAAEPVEYFVVTWDSTILALFEAEAGVSRWQLLWGFVTLLVCLLLWGRHAVDHVLTIHGDNVAALQDGLAMKGRGRMLDVAREIAWRKARYNWTFTTAHIPAELNDDADALSRLTAAPPKKLPG